MMPKMRMAVARLNLLADSSTGTARSTPTTTTMIATRVTRTSGSRRSSRGTGRTSRAACQVDTSPSRTRPPSGPPVTSSPTTTTRNSTGST